MIATLPSSKSASLQTKWKPTFSCSDAKAAKQGSIGSDLAEIFLLSSSSTQEGLSFSEKCLDLLSQLEVQCRS